MEVFFDNLIYNVIQSHHMFRDDGQHYQETKKNNSGGYEMTHNRAQVVILNVDLAEEAMFIFWIHPKLKS